MFSEVFERFIQNRPIAVMVRVLLESLLNTDQLDRWFDTVRQSQDTKDIWFSSIVGLMLNVVCNIRPSVHSAYRHSEIEASVVTLYGKSSISDKIESIVFAGRTLHVQEARVPVIRVDYGPVNSLHALSARWRDVGYRGRSFVTYSPTPRCMGWAAGSENRI